MNSSIPPDNAERRAEIAKRRFFGDGGLCARYEQIGDPLVQFEDIAGWLLSALPEVSRKTITTRFVLAAQHGDFGFRDYGPRRRAVASLIDLDGLEFVLGQYPLRPSAFTVALRPRLMRARGSVWAAWLASQGWPVPGWLDRSVPIEATINPAKDAGPGFAPAKSESETSEHGAGASNVEPRRRATYNTALTEWLAQKDVAVLRKIGSASLARGFVEYCKTEHPDLSPLLPKRPRAIESMIKQTIERRSKQARHQ